MITDVLNKIEDAFHNDSRLSRLRMSMHVRQRIIDRLIIKVGCAQG